MQNILHSLSAPSLYTETITEYTTVTLGEETYSPSLLSQYNAVAKSSFYTMPRGSIRTPHSQPLPTSTSLPKAAHTISTPRSSEQSTLMKAAKRSTYPRPSPPGFLYPDPIVPPTASELSLSTSHESMAESNVPWNSPYGLKVFLVTTFVLGVAWVVLSCLITSSQRAWTSVWSSKNKAERRPLDKPSKYLHNQKIMSRGDDSVDKNLTQVPQIYLPNHKNSHHTNSGYEYGGMEMKYRPRRRAQENLHTTTTQKQSPRAISPSPARSASASPQPSSTKPFFDSTVQLHMNPNSRFSSEYLASASTYDLATSEIEALEAGTASLTPRTKTLQSHERKKSWVDLGLAKVEDTVNGMMNRAIRWGNEDNEGVILPVANGGRDGRREVEVR